MKSVAIVISSMYFMLSCALVSDTGYLAQSPPSALREARQYASEQNPLQVMEKQTAEVNRLKLENQALKAQLVMSEAEAENMQPRLEKLQTQVGELESERDDLQEKLRQYEQQLKTKEQQLLDLAIAKVKIEQELVKLKIKLLEANQGETNGELP